MVVFALAGFSVVRAAASISVVTHTPTLNRPSTNRTMYRAPRAEARASSAPSAAIFFLTLSGPEIRAIE
jgi:hypothetical protein